MSVNRKLKKMTHIALRKFLGSYRRKGYQRRAPIGSFLDEQVPGARVGGPNDGRRSFQIYDDEIRTTKCWIQLSCFQTMNTCFLKHKMFQSSMLSRDQRCAIIKKLSPCSGKYHFIGKRVSSSFLLEFLRFSRKLKTCTKALDPSVLQTVPESICRPIFMTSAINDYEYTPEDTSHVQLWHFLTVELLKLRIWCQILRNNIWSSSVGRRYSNCFWTNSSFYIQAFPMRYYLISVRCGNHISA